jgi:hypothetical protein
MGKNNHLSCFSFGPPAESRLKKDCHTASMLTFFNPADEVKSGTIGIIVFSHGPKNRETSL